MYAFSMPSLSLTSVGGRNDYRFFNFAQRAERCVCMANENIDRLVIERVADALDMDVNVLLRDKRTCRVLTDLFGNSPHRARDKPSMTVARLWLSVTSAESTERAEVDNLIDRDREAAEAIESAAVELAESARRIIERCRKSKARQAGGPVGL